MTRQAYNVKARGGRIMLLVSNDRTFKERKNVDDVLGDKIDIATVIVTKDVGEEIKMHMENNTNDRVVLSIKFMGSKSGEAVNIDFYLRSDDVKSIHFFTEFKQYYNKLSTYIPH